jgi:iron complex outermembrane receptor protein
MKQTSRRTLGSLLISVAILLSGNCAFAATATNDTQSASINALPEVVVSATRSEITTDEAPAHVSVVTKQQIEAQRVQTVDAALKHESGVFVQRSKGIADSLPRVQLRGLNGANRTLVLLNGLPINNGYDGEVPWNSISTENIERIEIIRGPSSALYGSDALGGVINIITARPQKLEISGKAGYGSDNTIRHSLLAGDRIGDFTFRVGYEMAETGGYPTYPVNITPTAGAPNRTGGYGSTSNTGALRWVAGDKGDNSAERWNANLELGYDLSKTGTLLLDFQYGHSEYDYDPPHTYLVDALGNPSMTGRANTGGPLSANVTANSFVYYTGPGSEDYSATGIGYDDKFGELTSKTRVGFQTRDAWFTTAGTTGNYYTAAGSLSESTSRTWLGDWQGAIPVFGEHTFTFGFCFRYDEMNQDTYAVPYYRNPDIRTTHTDLSQGASCSQALYFQDEWKALENLTFYAGGRFEHWSAFDGQSGPVASVRQFSEPDSTAFTPKFSTMWHALDDTYVRGSIGQAFRAPTLYEMYRTWVSGTTTYNSNPNLDPETLWNFEGGVDQYFCDRRVKAGVTYFHSMLDDYISSYTVGTQNYKDNLASAQLDGIEAELSYKPWDWLKLWGNYTYTASEVLEYNRAPLAVGKQLTYMPEDTINVGADVSYKWIQWGIAGRYLGRIYTTIDNTDRVDNVSGAYTRSMLWDTHLTITPVKHVSISLVVENLLDQSYFTSTYTGRGRTYFAEVALKW